MFALVIVDDAASEGDLSALAVDHVIGIGQVLVKRGRVRHQLEDRAGLIDVADGVVAEQASRDWRGGCHWD